MKLLVIALLAIVVSGASQSYAAETAQSFEEDIFLLILPSSTAPHITATIPPIIGQKI